jgi:hypothetical protein
LTPEKYVLRETAISVAVNVTLSGVFFLVIFGLADRIPVWGFGAYVFDFVPQGFMIGLMATIVPGALARKALRQGRIEPSPPQSAAPSSLVLRALALGFLAAGIGTIGAATVTALFGANSVDWWSALVMKLVFAGALAATVTPLGLRKVFAERSVHANRPLK